MGQIKPKELKDHELRRVGKICGVKREGDDDICYKFEGISDDYCGVELVTIHKRSPDANHFREWEYIYFKEIVTPNGRESVEYIPAEYSKEGKVIVYEKQKGRVLNRFKPKQ